MRITTLQKLTLVAWCITASLILMLSRPTKAEFIRQGEFGTKQVWRTDYTEIGLHVAAATALFGGLFVLAGMRRRSA